MGTNERSSSISKYSVLLVVVILAQAFHHSFFFIRILFFRPRLNILIFLPILG